MVDKTKSKVGQNVSSFNYQRTGVLLVIISAVSRVFGFIREVLMTKYFGSSAETDAFFFALTMSSFFSIYLVSAVSQTFIPVLSEVDADKSVSTKRFYNNVVHAILLISIILLLLALVFVRPLTSVLARGIARNSYHAFELTVQLSRITMISILFPGLVGVFTGFLQYNRRFLAPTMIGIPLNASYLFYLIFFSERHGIIGLTWASVFASFAQVVFLLPSLKRSQYEYMPVLDFKDPYLRRMGRLSIPVIFSTIVTEASTLVDKSLATWLPAGSVTYLTYGGLINSTLQMVFVTSMSMMLFPAMSQAYSRKQLDRAHRYLDQANNAVSIIMIPLAIFVGVFAKDIVAILFQRGRFDSLDTINTAKIVSVYAFSLPAFSFMRIITNAFHANKDMRTPAIFSVLLLIFNVVFTLLFIKPMGVSGIALASGISSIIVTICLIILLRKKQDFVFISRYFVKTTTKAFLASVACLIFMLLGKHLYNSFVFIKRHNSLAFIVLSLIAFLLYLLIGNLMGMKEIKLLTKSIKTRFIRRH